MPSILGGCVIRTASMFFLKSEEESSLILAFCACNPMVKKQYKNQAGRIPPGDRKDRDRRQCFIALKYI
jgi:hypothetical protein